MLEYVNPKNIVIFTLLIILLVWINPYKIVNDMFYVKNGSSLDIPNYKVDFKRGRWAYSMDNKSDFFVNGKYDYLYLQISKHPSKFNATNYLGECVKQKTELISARLGINMYICEEATNQFVYFQSQNRDFFAKTKLNRTIDDNIKNQFTLFFQGLSPN